ncbi:MAG: hypothetical protein ENTB_03573 [Enterocloster aldenensis]
MGMIKGRCHTVRNESTDCTAAALNEFSDTP